MIRLMAQTMVVMSRCFYTGLVTIDEALFSCLRLDDITTDDDDNLDANQERIRESLLRIRRDLDQINVAELIDDMAQLFDEAFGGPQGFVHTMSAWADLVDTLVLATEREFGSEAGRGAYKKRTVKGALLYMVSRSPDVDIPRVPAFLEPLVWDVAFDALIDIVARVINENDLWEDVKLKPSLRARFSLEANRAGSFLEGLVRWLSKLAWKIVFAASPVPPSVKKAVDDYLVVNPQPVRTVVIVGAWITSHAQTLATLSDLISVMVVEAQVVINATEEEKKAYARDLVLAFIDEEVGLPRRGTLRYRLLVSVVEVGVEVVGMLFAKHNAGNTPTPTQEAVSESAPVYYDSYWPWEASEPVRFRHQ